MSEYQSENRENSFADVKEATELSPVRLNDAD